MACPPHIVLPNALYHVMARGNRRGPIVLDDEDRWMLTRILGEMAARTEIRVHAYALMDNHDHFVLETPKANLVAGMGKPEMKARTPTDRKLKKLKGQIAKIIV